MREYISRRGSAKFKEDHLVRARCPLLGYSLKDLKVDGQYVRRAFLQPETQAELGAAGYDEGAKVLTGFCKDQLKKFDTPELLPLGRKIIELCNNDAPLDDYLALMPMKF
jgi:hypothetical protein